MGTLTRLTRHQPTGPGRQSLSYSSDRHYLSETWGKEARSSEYAENKLMRPDAIFFPPSPVRWAPGTDNPCEPRPEPGRLVGRPVRRHRGAHRGPMGQPGIVPACASASKEADAVPASLESVSASLNLIMRRLTRSCASGPPESPVPETYRKNRGSYT